MNQLMKITISFAFVILSLTCYSQILSTANDTINGTGTVASEDINCSTSISVTRSSKVTWEVINQNLPSGWDFWICLDICYPPNVQSGRLNIELIQSLSCHCDPNGISGSGSFDIKFRHALLPSDTVMVRVECNAAVSNINDENEDFVKIYPNPTNNRVTIDMVNEQISSVSIYNTQGQSAANFSDLSDTKFTFATNEMVEGNYLIKVILDNGTTRYSYLNKSR